MTSRRNGRRWPLNRSSLTPTGLRWRIPSPPRAASVVSSPAHLDKSSHSDHIAGEPDGISSTPEGTPQLATAPPPRRSTPSSVSGVADFDDSERARTVIARRRLPAAGGTSSPGTDARSATPSTPPRRLPAAPSMGPPSPTGRRADFGLQSQAAGIEAAYSKFVVTGMRWETLGVPVAAVGAPSPTGRRVTPSRLGPCRSGRHRRRGPNTTSTARVNHRLPRPGHVAIRVQDRVAIATRFCAS